MQDFITGLQFLTRIRIINQTEWLPEKFGRSVKYFPLVGAVLGIVLAFIAHLLQSLLPSAGIYVPPHVIAALMLALTIILSGGLQCDGFMDTMDGIFSGRSRERMLEIMKDSRVGANGVMSFCLLLFIKWSLFLDISPTNLPIALFVMPILGRFAMVVGITLFPYARPEGIGKAFAAFAGKKSLLIAFAFTLLLLLPSSDKAAICITVTLLAAYGIGKYVTRLLGGLTGDIYGALTEIIEILVLLVFLF
ncbi:adenosylcobinamide-GDP ribazoletransferase [Sporomusaceae bacterium FL31]|nr:adenosylcobinamide-GDP ribazoletransferase [Sporomusaceae bacterium FL31]GCE33487.1 adenosylcobinamide-GDP ribazoletransferase [Sporomusaceae bacterium]